MFRGMRLWRVAVFAVVTAAILMGLNGLNRSRTTGAFLAATLAAHPQVEDATVDIVDGQIEATVKLGPVANLREAYLDVWQAAAATAGARSVTIAVTDQRDDQLLEDYYALHYYLAAALARGDFPDAAARLQQDGRQRGLDQVGFYVDPERVYLQLHRGDHFLYEIISREPAVAGLDWGSPT